MFLFVVLFAIAFTDTVEVRSEIIVPNIEVTPDTLRTGIFLSALDVWRYSPGDDLQWADPGFDDSDWIIQRPGGMQNPLPDSIWAGYGWFRARFTADESFYTSPMNLYLFTWGAAEVYFDGNFMTSFGTFSTDPDLERRDNPTNRLLPPFSVAPRDTHVIAIRFSYHPAHRYKKTIPEGFSNYGFGFGFVSHETNVQRSINRDISMRVSFFSVGVLFLITILHGFLYVLFRQQPANLLIAIITFLLLAHCIIAFSYVYFHVDAFWAFIFGSYSFLALYLTAVFLMPFTIVKLFNLTKLNWFKHILWLIVPMFVSGFFFRESRIWDNSVYVFAVSGLLVLFATCYALYLAYRKGERGVAFVGTGFLGLLLFTIATITYTTLGQALGDWYRWEIEAILITIIYISIPVSMSLFTAYRMAYLYQGMEGLVRERTEELENSLKNLQSTQAQLVQQEKLASLGQLTAGIAHEIKNPLNFVNNFSSVSKELIDEVVASEYWTEADSAIEAGSNEEQKSRLKSLKQYVLDDLQDVQSNLEKINDHGTRADRIVKSMLLHSRGGSGKKEPTDINALLREYTNLAFHGMRAGKNPISCDIQLDLDANVANVSLLAEDFSRVLLNLCNNAFDAMRVKTKEPEGASYKPRLCVRSKAGSNGVVIEVEDNGPGIPADIKEKIMEPFFTTKKGTEGTGLGLSITNDIVKAHGGSLDIESEPGKTIFRIQLPSGS